MWVRIHFWPLFKNFFSYCFASQDSFCLVGLISCTFTVCLLIIATILLYYAIKTRRVRRELQARSERSTIASRDMGDLARYFVDVGYVTAMRHSLPVQNEFKSTVRSFLRNLDSMCRLNSYIWVLIFGSSYMVHIIWTFIWLGCPRSGHLAVASSFIQLLP